MFCQHCKSPFNIEMSQPKKEDVFDTSYIKVCVLLYFCNNYETCKFAWKAGFFSRIGRHVRKHRYEQVLR